MLPDSNEMKELVDWKDFFNFEAKRITELSTEELRERIQKYSKIIFAAKAFQHASVVHLQSIETDERKRTMLEDLNYVPEKPVKEVKTKRGPRKDKTEKQIESLMAVLNCSREAAMNMINKNKGK